MRRELLRRLGLGALCGAAGMAPLMICWPYGPASDLTVLCGSTQGAEWIRLLAGMLWGAAVCAGAMIWCRERGSFFTNSLWNYLLDCGAFVFWALTCQGYPGGSMGWVLWGLFTWLYAIGWVVRWYTCGQDVERIQRELGIAIRSVSRWKWRETVPYALLTATVFWSLAMIGRLLDKRVGNTAFCMDPGSGGSLPLHCCSGGLWGRNPLGHLSFVPGGGSGELPTGDELRALAFLVVPGGLHCPGSGGKSGRGFVCPAEKREGAA